MTIYVICSADTYYICVFPGRATCTLSTHVDFDEQKVALVVICCGPTWYRRYVARIMTRRHAPSATVSLITEHKHIHERAQVGIVLNVLGLILAILSLHAHLYSYMHISHHSLQASAHCSQLASTHHPDPSPPMQART